MENTKYRPSSWKRSAIKDTLSDNSIAQPNENLVFEIDRMKKKY